MSATTISETCACGATFKVTAQWSSDASKNVQRWREDHRHAESVGICGDRPPPLMLGDVEVATTYCELKAGHTGMHADHHGGHWTIREDA